MDRLEAMSTLVAVIDAGSLSAAGRRMGVPLPTVSRRISELEARLGARLLLRSTRRLALTEAGAAFLASARRILDQVDEAERAAAGEHLAPRGELVVAAPVLFGRLHVMPLVTAYLAQHPEIRVRLDLSDRNTDLIEDHIDVAVRIGRLPDSGLIATRLGAVRGVFCASPAFLAAHGMPRSASDLAGLDAVVFQALGSRDSWPGGGAGRTRLTATTAEAALDAAIAGVGVTRVLSYQAAAAVRAGRLRLILPDLDGPDLDVSLIHADQGRMALKTRAFLDMAGPHLRRELAALPG